MRGLRVRGLLSHAGHAYAATSEVDLHAIAEHEADTLARLRDGARAEGIGIDEVSVGATPPLRFTASVARSRGITELRPGNYVFFDRTQVALGAARVDECALTVIATIVSKPAPDRIVLDCGSKVLTSDAARGLPAPRGFGAVLDGGAVAIDDGFSIDRLSEEHATVRVGAPTRLRIGDRVRVLPNHSCVVANMVDAAALVEDDRVVDMLPVAARGKIT
jgi:D-serine deaminase-like pyridoxal phosphate-dependent protein